MKKLIIKLTKYVFTTNNSITNYDIAIVFGGPDMIPYRISKAIELYKSKKIKKILITGGIGYFSKDKATTEATTMFNYLKSHNIPKKDIIIENKSRNTKENILNSINIITNKYTLNKTKIILISSDYHIKRCKLIFSKYSKNISIYGTKSSINKDNWYTTKSGILTIIKESFLIKFFQK